MEQKKPKRPRGKVRVIEGKCIACGARCQAACPVDGIDMNDNGEPVIHLAKCIGCRKCVKVCPVRRWNYFILLMNREFLMNTIGMLPKMMKDGNGVLKDGRTSGFMWSTLKDVRIRFQELLGVGRQLANDLEVELSAFILGYQNQHLIAEAFAYGADKVYVIDDPVLKYYRTSPYLQAGIQLIQKYKPEIVLIGATGLGRDFAGALATELRTGLTADCTGLTISKSDRLLEQTRPAFGGNIMATILSETARPQMASVRPHVMPKPEYHPERKGSGFHEF